MHCTTCDSFATADSARVVGTNDGRVFACPNSTSMTAVADGAAATPAAAALAVKR